MPETRHVFNPPQPEYAEYTARNTRRPPKKVRGPTQKNELWNMNNNKIVVKFNKYGKPVGVEGSELTQFLGSVIRIAGNVRLHCEDWRKVDKEKKEDMYSIVKEKFVFHPAETSAIKKWVLSSMGKKLNTWRNLVKSQNYHPALSVEEIKARDHLCEQKGESPLKNGEPHISYWEQNHLLRLAEKRHPYKLLKMTTNTQGIQEDDWTNDEFSKVKGPDKSGYVRCVGKMLSLRTMAPQHLQAHNCEHTIWLKQEDQLYTLGV
ncbi:hypothetical protein Tco_0551518 [Tanacetum coccineum]